MPHPAEPLPRTLSFRSLRDEPQPQRYLSDVLDWAYEATWPSLGWLLGGSRATGEATLISWMERDSSEASIRRFTMLCEDAKSVGGFVALPGADVAACRHADTRALIAASERARRPQLLARLRIVAGLHAPLEADVYYLSRIGVSEQRRGRGLGGVLLDEYLADGHRCGFRKFMLEVAPGNAFARRLYESRGFHVDTIRHADAVSSVSMTLER